MKLSVKYTRLVLSHTLKSLIIVAVLTMTACSARFDPLPDFKGFQDVKAMKRAFYAYMLPIVEEQNNDILNQRARLLALRAEFDEAQKLGWLARLRLLDLAAHYELDDPAMNTAAIIDELTARIDIVPSDLALVQAAKESGWGRSRFAVEYNNLFGHWCYKPGCGAVPKRRPKGESYEVAEFHSVSESVRRYINNLNTHERYSEFRRLRALRRASGLPLEGGGLAVGLLGYSQRGEVYIDELRAMLNANNMLFKQASAR